MPVLYNLLRILLQLFLLIIFGKYLEDVVSFPFLAAAYFFSLLLAWSLVRLRLRGAFSFFLLLLWPWLIRLFVIAFQQISPSFLQISFDMSFYFTLLPVYLFSLLTWLSLTHRRFGRYEVLVNGIILFVLFRSQGNYRVSLVPEPFWLAVFALVFLFLELLVLYLAVARERSLLKRGRDVLRETIPFLLVLLPMLFFMLLPLWREYEEGSVAGGGGLLKSSLFRFDFSEYIKLETEISMSDDLVLMFRKEGPAERLLLRRYVLSGYEDGQGFYRHDKDKSNPPDKVPTRYTEYEDPAFRNREKVNQELFLVNIDPAAFISLNYPVNVQPVYNWDDSSFVRIYRTEALVNTRPIREIDPSVFMAEGDREHYTYRGSNDAIEEMAREITENIPGSLLKTAAIERYFHENYFYSLKPGVAPDGDQLSWFLEETKKGYCSYFAFSMALMCRSIGIPARVAVGFWVDPDVSVLNFYPVRADQAHAWVEVYFEEYGWMEFDPTSSTMYPGEQYPFAGFTIDEFSSLIEEILDNELIAENLAEPVDNADRNSESGAVGEQILRFFRVYWPFLVASVYISVLLFYHKLYRILYFLQKPVRRKAGHIYRELRHLLSFERKPYRETVSDYALRLKKNYGVSFPELTSLYLKSLYSQEFSQDDLSEMKKLRQRIIEEYRHILSPLRRILHFFLPFVRNL
ncbi:transglutaminase-like domain-containing protein [Spirochaeta isovalerica]|uniref:Transglutaminase-like putative cysteine protease n=1 Tax=Spirochaeta isovalerica TaxID=150 RepID=A0A841RFN2_9SPIO|nr:transglutaminase-like domain-containing protein [Spirochaeta isovalerica]MBB6482027.1 transglutaminase-like putative cysteine protease [Spirochaeta isovalerica]